MFKIVCSWCKRVMREGESDRISHTCCPDCAAHYFPCVKMEAAEAKS